MVGWPKRRAKRIAAAIQEGREPEVWVDNRPMKKPPQRERGWRIIQEKQMAGLRGPPGGGKRSAASSIPDVDDPALQILLGGLSADDLDEESNLAFEDLRKLGFAFAREVMELPLVAADKNFQKLLAVKLAITQTVFTATTRVRPGDLREKDDDGVGALLEEVRRESGQNGARSEGAAGDGADAKAAAQAAARADLFS